MRVMATSFPLLPIASASVALVSMGRSQISTLRSSASSVSSTSSSSPIASPTAVAVDCTDTSRTSSPSCWDTLGMDLWMFNWNTTTTACSPGETWSNFFLRLAFEAPGYDCSTIGSIFCPAAKLGGTPSEAHAFYAAYNIYGMSIYPTLS